VGVGWMDPTALSTIQWIFTKLVNVNGRKWLIEVGCLLVKEFSFSPAHPPSLYGNVWIHLCINKGKQ
jgi:hypothetical protein